jgi:hypothetical protein
VERTLIEFIDKAKNQDLQELLLVLDEVKHGELISFLLAYLTDVQQNPK